MGKVFGIISLILGIAGLAYPMYLVVMFGPSFFWLLTLITAGPGIIIGAIGIKKDDRTHLAIAGLIISSIAIILLISFMVAGDFMRDLLFFVQL